jgi:hypothetical protein
MPLDNKPGRIDLDSLFGLENLASASHSNYDCDSEGEASRTVVDSKSDETRGSSKPGVMNLKFQLDAAKVGECCIATHI